MVEAFFDTDFARVTIRAKGEGLKGKRRGPQQCPDPRPGFRIDWCVLDALRLEWPTDTVIDVSLELDAKAGWTMSQEDGEALICTTFEHAEGHQAAVGMRDYDWLARVLNMTFLEGSGSQSPFRARFKTKSSAERDIEISLALTLLPATETEANSPWFMVDKALQF